MNENFWVNDLKDFKKTGLIFQTLLRVKRATYIFILDNTVFGFSRQK